MALLLNPNIRATVAQPHGSAATHRRSHPAERGRSATASPLSGPLRAHTTVSIPRQSFPVYPYLLPGPLTEIGHRSLRRPFRYVDYWSVRGMVGLTPLHCLVCRMPGWSNSAPSMPISFHSLRALAMILGVCAPRGMGARTTVLPLSGALRSCLSSSFGGFRVCCWLS